LKNFKSLLHFKAINKPYLKFLLMQS